MNKCNLCISLANNGILLKYFTAEEVFYVIDVFEKDIAASNDLCIICQTLQRYVEGQLV